MAKSVKQPVETPPYLKQVRIRDYRSIRDAKADFKPGLNIIIGHNGAGKTNFSTIANSLLEPYSKHNDGNGCELILGGHFEINVTFENPKAISSKVDNTETDDFRYAINDESSTLSVTANLGSQSVSEQTLDKAIDLLINKPERKTFLQFSYLPILIRHGIPSSRLPVIDERADLVIGKSISLSLDGEKNRILNIESRFIQALLRSINRVIRVGFTVVQGIPVPPLTADSARELIVRSVDDYLIFFNEYLPLYSPITSVRRNDLFQVYHDTIQDEFLVKGLVLEYEIGGNALPLPFSALSDGTKRLFYLLTEILSPTLIALDKLSGNSRIYDARKIIFLEEPELGIHPEQLHKLLSLIREVSREHQVIMTTHSPQVLDMLSEKELDRITICELDPKKGTQFRKLSPAKREEARAYMREKLHLSDYWRYSYLEEKD